MYTYDLRWRQYKIHCWSDQVRIQKKTKICFFTKWDTIVGCNADEPRGVFKEEAIFILEDIIQYINELIEEAKDEKRIDEEYVDVVVKML
jgi:hypothetical protein